MDAPLAELADVHRSYTRGGETVRALRGVSLQVAPAELIVISGPSGSGKSTLLHVMAGLDRPSQGEVRLEGRSLADMPDDDLTLYRRRRLGFIFQFFHLLPNLSAAENVALPLLLDGRPPGEATDVARERLDTLGLADRASHRPRELSGGEQQRVAIARALIADPALLLADEPTGNLDSESGAGVYDVLKELPSTHGTALVLVTHDPRALELGDRALRLQDGRLSPNGRD